MVKAVLVALLCAVAYASSSADSNSKVKCYLEEYNYWSMVSYSCNNNWSWTYTYVSDGDFTCKLTLSVTDNYGKTTNNTLSRRNCVTGRQWIQDHLKVDTVDGIPRL